MTLALYPSVVEAEAKLSSFSHRLQSHLDSDGRWESDRAGRVIWTDGQPLATPGDAIGCLDVDTPLTAAFERRAPFRDLDNGAGWSLSAVPYFETGSGRFLGFRGHARRTVAAVSARDLFGTGASADAFANMAHEARTPLSAIMGFAQMIEAETLGEAGEDYRSHAAAIVRNATRLLDAVDDLASAAQLEQGRYPVIQGSTDVGDLLARLVERHAPLAARRSVRIDALVPPDIGSSPIDSRLLNRAFDRVAAALLTVASEETLAIAARRAGDWIEVVVSRPHAIAGRSPESLLDPARLVPDANGFSAVLGLGFGFRLASALITATGGAFVIEAECVRIRIAAIAKRAATA